MGDSHNDFFEKKTLPFRFWMKLGSSTEKRLIKDINPLGSSLYDALELQGLSNHWKTEQYPDWGF